MKKVFINAMFFCAISAAVLSSCSTENDPTDPKDENELSGAINSTVTLDATKEYTLNGTVTVEEGGELVIPAGTTIKCKKGFSNYLIVLQGGKINAKGWYYHQWQSPDIRRRRRNCTGTDRGEQRIRLRGFRSSRQFRNT